MTHHTNLESKEEMSASQSAVQAGPIRVDPIVVPITVSVGHSLLLTALVLLAVSVQLAFHRLRNRTSTRNHELGRLDEGIYPMRLSEWMETTQPDHIAPNRRSLLDALRELTTIR